MNFRISLTLSLLTNTRVEKRGRQLSADRLCQFASCQPIDRQKFLHRRLRVLSHAFEGFPLFDLGLAVGLVAPLIFKLRVLIVQTRRLCVQDAAPTSFRRIGIWTPRLKIADIYKMANI